MSFWLIYAWKDKGKIKQNSANLSRRQSDRPFVPTAEREQVEVMQYDR